MANQLVPKPLGMQDYNGPWDNDVEVKHIFDELINRGVSGATARVLADEKRRKPVRREIREAWKSMNPVTTGRYHYYKERFGQTGDHDAFAEFDTSIRKRSPVAAAVRAFGASYWYVATQTGDILENLGLPKIPSIIVASSLAAVPFLCAGSTLPVIGTKTLDPYSYDRVRVIESRLDERDVGNGVVYEWNLAARDKQGRIINKKRYVQNPEAAARISNITYGDDVDLPSGGMRNWFTEALEPESWTDARFTESLSVSPSVYEGQVRGAATVEYYKGRGTMIVTVNGKKGSRSITYVGDEELIKAANEMLGKEKSYVRFNTDGNPALLISNLSGGYNGS
ncbi:MAG: hypothetical protein HY513_01730 [Candidatus Aenigmarchaeota archaeon]|nr:hypothetical protein [Candidatus Aenigmarchaeota archaeon]